MQDLPVLAIGKMPLLDVLSDSEADGGAAIDRDVKGHNIWLSSHI
jgi:hypothetical protein